MDWCNRQTYSYPGTTQHMNETTCRQHSSLLVTKLTFQQQLPSEQIKFSTARILSTGKYKIVCKTTESGFASRESHFVTEVEVFSLQFSQAGVETNWNLHWVYTKCSDDKNYIFIGRRIIFVLPLLMTQPRTVFCGYKFNIKLVSTNLKYESTVHTWTCYKLLLMSCILLSSCDI